MENRLKLRISSMFRSSFGSCRSKNILDAMEQPFFLPQNRQHSQLFELFSPRHPSFPSSICRPKWAERAETEHSCVTAKDLFPRSKVSDQKVRDSFLMSGDMGGRKTSPISPFNTSYVFEMKSIEKMSRKTRKKKSHMKNQKYETDQFHSSVASNYYGWYSSSEDDDDTTFFSSKSLSSGSSESFRRKKARYGKSTNTRRPRVARKDSATGLMPLKGSNDEGDDKADRPEMTLFYSKFLSSNSPVSFRRNKACCGKSTNTRRAIVTRKDFETGLMPLKGSNDEGDDKAERPEATLFSSKSLSSNLPKTHCGKSTNRRAKDSETGLMPTLPSSKSLSYDSPKPFHGNQTHCSKSTNTRRTRVSRKNLSPSKSLSSESPNSFRESKTHCDISTNSWRTTKNSNPGLMLLQEKNHESRHKRVGMKESEMGLIPLKGKVKDSFAVMKNSSDPYSDFRTSMVEMIVERQIFGGKELENMLQCFLSLNSHHHHRVIIEVFTEIWEALFSNCC